MFDIDPLNLAIGLATLGFILMFPCINKKAKKADDRRNNPDSEEFRADLRKALKIEPEPDTSLEGTRIMSEPYKVEDEMTDNEENDNANA